MEIDGKDLFISQRKQWAKNKNVHTITIMTMKNKKALDDGKDINSADWLDFDDVKAFLNLHKKQLFKGASRYQINVLTPEGWRSTKSFTEKPSWNNFLGYNDKDGEPDEVLAIEILYWI